MTDSDYKICCIMPTKNQAKYIRESIDSILKQTFKNFHLIVIDNGSTDETWTILKGYEDRYKKKDNTFPMLTIDKELSPGTGAALNKGLRINNQTSKSEYVTWFASDNFLNESAFFELNKFLDEHENIDMVYSNMNIHIFKDQTLIKVKNLKEEVGNQEWNSDKIFVNYFLGCIWLFRDSIRVKAGTWYIHEPCEDYEQVIRFVFAGGQLAFLDKNLGWFRRHDENMSAKLRNTGYAENLVARMIQIKKENKGKEYIEFVRWKYEPAFYNDRKNINFGDKMDNGKDVFTKIYKNNVWGGRESKSGKGSDLEQTKRIINRIPILINKYDIKSIVDIGCGDLNWIKHVLLQFPKIHYTGIDIVDDLIVENKKNFPQYEFFSFNFLDKNLNDFDHDLILCRDVLVHLSFNSIISFLYKVANSRCKYLLTSSFSRYDRRNEKDIDLKKGISWRTVNLVKSPFNLIDPIEVINERCTQIDTDGSDFKDKSLALWSTKDIRKSLNIIEPKEIYQTKVKKKVEIKKEKWHLSKINKVINFYWGGKRLPYLRYLTVKTFSILNPDWKINFYFTKNVSDNISWVSEEHKFDNYNANSYYKELKNIKNVTFTKINDEKYKDYPEVFKSDILRWKLLTLQSGIWADMDIIFTKPMNECEFNDERNVNCDTGVQICSGMRETYHTIGFMISAGNNEYFRYINGKIENGIINFNNYQSLGVVLLNNEFPTLNSLKAKFPNLYFFNIDKDLFYNFYPIDRVAELYKLNGRDYSIQKTIGIHWYGGYKLSGDFCKQINHKNIWNMDCLLVRKIKDVLKRE